MKNVGDSIIHHTSLVWFFKQLPLVLKSILYQFFRLEILVEINITSATIHYR